MPLFDMTYKRLPVAQKSLAEISLSKGLLFNMDTFQTPSGIILYPKTT